ncbi:SDR family NAD(P)-dependent oxidoreductase [Pelosinus sp. sgz500959]|uniref:SDR family NAD(P)-dependent oxidoreductase n=1 Tax=Pelosinus sp. sgz500959 TaxID=3242472 RepID=UPI00366C5994
MSNFKGKIALVTGGSSGIGFAIAKRFVDEGAKVFITGRRIAELEKAKQILGENITCVQGDVSNLADLDSLFKVIAQKAGRLDVLVANAGIVENRFLQDVTAESYNRIFDINTRGTFFTVQKSLPLLADGSSIVLLGTCLSIRGLPGSSVYIGSKAAVRSFARAWAAELKTRQIRVNTLSPGTTETPIIDGQFKSKEEADAARVMMANITPLGRLGRADEIAAAAYFLASDESSFCTGMDLFVDGGLSQL